MVFCKIPESISDGVTKLLLPNQHLQIGDLNPPGEGDVLNVTSGSSRYFRMESCNFLETEIYNIHISYIYIYIIYIYSSCNSRLACQVSQHNQLISFTGICFSVQCFTHSSKSFLRWLGSWWFINSFPPPI